MYVVRHDHIFFKPHRRKTHWQGLQFLLYDLSAGRQVNLGGGKPGGPSQWCQVFGGEKVAVCVNKWDVSPTRDAVHGIFQVVCGLLGLRAGDLDASPLK